ncbi:MAG: ABC transporter ATP-binding protein [Candidatus Dormibacteraeota bacterium]|nr:ABC transporter ATP-binding protein [Candidatus Dormibacteraeota bacterium]
MSPTSSVLRTDRLTKSFGSRLAVDALDLAVESGEIFGFLGPNGAGKTTTIRMCLGLIRPGGGSIELLGRDLRSHRRRVLPRVGALIESPALYSYMSGRDNLLVFGDALGGVSASRIDEVLELVGLRGRGRDRVRSYSLGMKQRLGLAAAMLHEPELLILDEPANGLDPAGIVEMRDLLRFLAAQGRTVFLSSHVLSEVQQICDRVAIINEGRLVTVAPVAQLIRDSGEFVVRLSDLSEALTLVRQQPWGAAARITEGTLVTAAPGGRGRDLNQFLVAAGLVPDSVSQREQDLEEIFLTLTGGGR